MDTTTFVYTTYIAAAPEKVWKALTDPEFTKQFWFGREVKSDFKPGSPVTFTMPNGKVNISGKIIKCDPPSFMEWTFQDVSTASLEGEEATLVTYELEPTTTGEKAVWGTKLTITHVAKTEKLFGAISNGWTLIMAGLKTLLETGKPMM